MDFLVAGSRTRVSSPRTYLRGVGWPKEAMTMVRLKEDDESSAVGSSFWV